MLVIAHRGASDEFPENSLLAFEQAIAAGVNGIELDVHFHQQSEQYIVLHDVYLDKTTNGIGHYNDFSINQLTQLTLGQGQHLVTLPQALALIKGRVFVNIELKTVESSVINLEYQLAILHDILCHAMTCDQFTVEQLILSSFNHLAIYQCNRQLEQFSRAALISHNPYNLQGIIDKLGVSLLNVDIHCLNQKLVTNCHEIGLGVWVYTVDRIEDIQSCSNFGVDGIFTNSPRNSINQLSTR
jgi:glycerophosphoryl diester phosphodiesterase